MVNWSSKIQLSASQFLHLFQNIYNNRLMIVTKWLHTLYKIRIFLTLYEII